MWVTKDQVSHKSHCTMCSNDISSALSSHLYSAHLWKSSSCTMFPCKFYSCVVHGNPTQAYCYNKIYSMLLGEHSWHYRVTTTSRIPHNLTNDAKKRRLSHSHPCCRGECLQFWNPRGNVLPCTRISIQSPLVRGTCSEAARLLVFVVKPKSCPSVGVAWLFWTKKWLRRFF